MTELTSPPALSPLSIAPLMDGGNVLTTAPSQSSNAQALSVPTNMTEISLTFLMISGRRRTMSFAASTTIGRVKELVWNSWPSDWSDERPPAPNYLRILYLGKMLQDEDALDSIHNPLSPSGPGLCSPSRPTSPTSSAAQPQPTIVHLSVRPVPPPSETNDVKKKRRRIGSSSSAGANGDAERANCCAACVIC